MMLLLSLGRLLLAALLGHSVLVGDKGVATRFGDPGDPLDGDHLFCTRQKMEPGVFACAHRTLPCGSVVVVHNPRTNRMAACQVLDRGPFGANMPGGQWGLKIRPEDPGTWRGVIDLSPAVATALDFNGRERVNLLYQRHRVRVAQPPLAPLGAVVAARSPELPADTEPEVTPEVTE